MKVAFINDIIHGYAVNSSSAVGGAERYQWLLARALARSGISVTVGVRASVLNGAPRSIAGVKFVSLSAQNPLRAWHDFLASEQPDWWYWQCADHLWGPAVELAKYHNVRTIFSVGVDRDVLIRKALYRRPYFWPLYAWGLWRNDKIFVQHEWQLLHLPALLRPKASILPGIVTQPPAIRPHHARENYVAWVAMLREVKRPDLLIEVARNMPQTRFIVGGGMTTFFARPGYGDQIVNELRTLPNVDYRGKVAPEEAIEIIANAGLLLSTSYEEGFPSTFLEAWSAGTPVVTLVFDPGSIIKRFGLGIVSGIDLAAITNSIAYLLRSPDVREQIGRRAQDYISTHHSETSAVKSFRETISN